SALLATEEAAVLAEALDQRVAEHDAADTDATAAAAAARAADPDTAPDEPVEPEPNYSKAERRADALMSLICGDTPTHPDAASASKDTDGADGGGPASTSSRPGAPAGTGQAPVLRPKVTVIATG
ncbi:HNH endonuclease, partial [Dietzia sp. Marseille-Q0999]|nr:HNH endonuclease [Dietzia massiliensis]